MQIYVYIGQEMLSDNNTMDEINRRIISEKNPSAFGKINIILTSNMPLCFKIKVFYQCLLYALTYWLYHAKKVILSINFPKGSRK